MEVTESHLNDTELFIRNKSILLQCLDLLKITTSNPLESIDDISNITYQNNSLSHCLKNIRRFHSPTQPYILPLWQQILWAVIFGVMVTVAVLGNSIVIWIVLAHRRMRSVTNFFLVNLSITDLMMAIFNTIFSFVFMLSSHWPFGGPYCTFYYFIGTLSVSSSVFTITAISVDRYKMEQIEIKIKETLPSVSEILLKSIVERLVELGVSEISHLGLVEENDLLPVLKVIQARLLVKSWRNEVGNTSSVSDVVPQVEVKSKETTIQNAEKKTATNNLEWAHDFIIPWENMPQELIKSLEEDKRPSPSLRRQMVRIVADAIQKITEKPGKKALGIIARKMVKKYSSSLADSLCGEIVGEGYSSLHKQMEVRFDNLNRTNPLNTLRRKIKQSSNGDKRKLGVSDSYGCINWQPPSLPIHENEETQKSKQLTMSEMATKPKALDRALVKTLLQETYYTARKQINNGNSIANLKKEWPLLFSEDGIYDHFESLVGFNVYQKLRDSLQSKGFRIMSYLKSVSNVPKYKAKFEQWMSYNKCNEDPNFCTLLLLLMEYFNENIKELFITVDINTTSEDILQMELPVTPCIICYGENVTNSSSFMLLIEHQVAVESIEDFTNAVALMFAAFFCFNIHYPQSTCATLEFIQRCFLGITPNKGSKTNPEKKRKEQINSKVLSLINKLSNFEWNN